MKRQALLRIVPGLAIAGLAATAAVHSHAQENKAAKPVKMTVAQARQTIDMLNDAYVTAVVVTHSTYVKDRATPAAAVVARKLFAAMESKGWPQTRWLNTTGRPFNPDSNPKDQFERDAVTALKKGQPKFERIEDGKLRVATLIPLVDKSCQMCHTKDKVGDPIGGLAYTIPLEQ
jgi:hypothetical protein